MRVLPGDFLSGTPPRIMGTECEYDVQGQGRQGLLLKSFSEDEGAHYLLGPLQEKLGLQHNGQFLSNGARLYKDVGHLEYATPECLGPAQAVAADFAGLLIMEEVVADYTKNSRCVTHLYRHTGSFMPYREGCGRQTVTHGYHENYLIPAQINDRVIDFDIFRSYLATRVWASVGAVGHRGPTLSQKAPGIESGMHENHGSLSHGTNEGRKPLYVVRNDDEVIGEHYAGWWSRVEVRFADAGLSKDARFLAMASASLALRLVEHADELQPYLTRIPLVEPGRAARVFGDDLTFKKTMKNYEGEDLTWINVQELVLTALRVLSKLYELPAEEEVALLFWEETLEDCKNSDPLCAYYPERFRERFDLPGRHFFLRHKIEGELTTRNTEAIMKSLAWERVYPIGIGLRYFGRKPSKYVSDSSVEGLKSNAPQATRASNRARTVKHGYVEGKLTWSTYRKYPRSELISFGPMYA